MYRQERDIGMMLSVREMLVFFAYVQHSEANRVSFKISILPDLTVAELASLWNIISEQAQNLSLVKRLIGERPGQKCLVNGILGESALRGEAR